MIAFQNKIDFTGEGEQMELSVPRSANTRCVPGVFILAIGVMRAGTVCADAANLRPV